MPSYVPSILQRQQDDLAQYRNIIEQYQQNTANKQGQSFRGYNQPEANYQENKSNLNRIASQNKNVHYDDTRKGDKGGSGDVYQVDTNTRHALLQISQQEYFCIMRKKGVRVQMYQDYTYPNILNHFIDNNG